MRSRTWDIYRYSAVDVIVILRKRIGKNGNLIPWRGFLWAIMHPRVSMLSMM